MESKNEKTEIMLSNLRQEMDKQDKYFDYTIQENQIVIHENSFYQKRWPSHTIALSEISKWVNFRMNNMKNIAT